MKYLILHSFLCRDVHRGGGKWGIAPPDPSLPLSPEIGPQKVLTDEYWVNSREKRRYMLKKFLRLASLAGPVPVFYLIWGKFLAIFGVKVVKKCQFSTLVFDEGKCSPTLVPP